MDKTFRAKGTAACAGIVAYWRRCIGLLTYSWLLDDTTGYCRRSFGCSPSQSGFDGTDAMAEMTISEAMARRSSGCRQALLGSGRIKLQNTECPAKQTSTLTAAKVRSPPILLKNSLLCLRIFKKQKTVLR